MVILNSLFTSENIRYVSPLKNVRELKMTGHVCLHDTSQKSWFLFFTKVQTAMIPHLYRKRRGGSWDSSEVVGGVKERISPTLSVEQEESSPHCWLLYWFYLNLLQLTLQNLVLATLFLPLWPTDFSLLLFVIQRLTGVAQRFQEDGATIGSGLSALRPLLYLSLRSPFILHWDCCAQPGPEQLWLCSSPPSVCPINQFKSRSRIWAMVRSFM